VTAHSFLAHTCNGSTLLCVHLKKRSRTSYANDSSKNIEHCARKTYVNVDLELFCIRKLDICFGLSSMLDTGVMNPGALTSKEADSSNIIHEICKAMPF
jgi:hypothetical protein